jgi:hypothetical protein
MVFTVTLGAAFFGAASWVTVGVPSFVGGAESLILIFGLLKVKPTALNS